MRRNLLDIAVLFVLATGGCVYVALAQPGVRSVAIHVYILFIGALVMLTLVAALGDSAPRRRRSAFDRALAASARKERPPAEIERVQREVTLGLASAYDFHVRLLPHLREVAQCRLERSGRTSGPDTLGRWWDVLRPDRPEPTDRFARGISESELRALVADLERM